MKRIIRLTESDLTRIIRRIINEQPIGLAGVDANSVKDVVTSLVRDPNKPQTCSSLDGLTTDEIHSKVKSEKFNSGKGKAKYKISHGIGKKQEIIYNEDPYSYVQLHNGKYCIKHQSKKSWSEVTDSKQIEAVKKEIEKEDY